MNAMYRVITVFNISHFLLLGEAEFNSVKFDTVDIAFIDSDGLVPVL